MPDPTGYRAIHGTDFLRLHDQCRRTAASGTPALPVYSLGDRVAVGPGYRGGDRACLGCLEYRLRLATDAANLNHPWVRLWSGTPALSVRLTVEAVLDDLRGTDTLDSSDATQPCYLIDQRGARLHRLHRSVGCYACRHRAQRAPATEASLGPSLRGARFQDRAPRDEFVHALHDDLVGPITGLVRVHTAYGAMTGAMLPQSPNMGFGRAIRFDQAAFVAVMEAYERLCGHPFTADRLLSRHELPDTAILLGELDLGGYHDDQLAARTSRIRTPRAPARLWVAGRAALSDQTVHVPADIAFYNYEPAFGVDYHRARRSRERGRDKDFQESSSGSALGASFAEAGLHALLEVLERDAFLRFWYRRDVLPTLALTDLPPTPAELVEEIEAAGFEPIAVVMPGPGGVAVLGAFAFQRDGRFPYVFCAAGSGLTWETALTAGLWELVNIIRTPRERTRAQIAAALRTRWDVRTIDDHIDYHLLPHNGIRVRAKCGGPRLTLSRLTSIAPDPELPQALSALDLIAAITERLHRAGLGEPVFIDQGNVELADLGLHAVKCVVPGALPMTFGTAHLRVRGLETLRTIGRADLLHGTRQLEPHPFP